MFPIFCTSNVCLLFKLLFLSFIKLFYVYLVYPGIKLYYVGMMTKISTKVIGLIVGMPIASNCSKIFKTSTSV